MAAEDNGRSMTAEIIQALEAAYPAPNPRDVVLDAIVLLADLQRQMKEAGGSDANLQALKAKCDAIIAKLKQDPDLTGADGAQTQRELAVLLSYLRT